MLLTPRVGSYLAVALRVERVFPQAQHPGVTYTGLIGFARGERYAALPRAQAIAASTAECDLRAPSAAERARATCSSNRTCATTHPRSAQRSFRLPDAVQSSEELEEVNSSKEEGYIYRPQRPNPIFFSAQDLCPFCLRTAGVIGSGESVTPVSTILNK